jgi:hypothetical protein
VPRQMPDKAPMRHFLIGAFHDGRSRSFAVSVQPTAPENQFTPQGYDVDFDSARLLAEAKAADYGDPIPPYAHMTIEEQTIQ